MKYASQIAFVAALLLVLLPRTAQAKDECVEVSDVVGERQCSRYGAGWAHEQTLPLIFRFGLRAAQLSPDGIDMGARFRKKGPIKYRFPSDAMGVSSLHALGFEGGVSAFIAGQLYFGTEMGAMFGAQSGRDLTAGNYQLRDRGGLDVLVLTAGSHLGYRVPLGILSLRFEIFGGAMRVQVNHGVTGPGAPKSAWAIGDRALLEPRAAVDIWASQHLTVSAYAGVDVLNARGYAAGISMAWHHRAFDGDFALW